MTSVKYCDIIALPLRRGFFCVEQYFKFEKLLAPIEGDIIISGGANLMRVKLTLACNECKQRNYESMKNKKNDPDRLEMNKYCRFCRKHTQHRETK